jgi:hypothetical protein
MRWVCVKPRNSEKFPSKVDGETASRAQDVSVSVRAKDIHVFDAAGDAVSCAIR